MNKERKKCPYCSRKIGYGRRLLENSKGEHICRHCRKNSNIKQNPLIWIVLVVCLILALSIMIFYFSAAKSIQDTYDDTGKMKFLVTIFFGTFKDLKWIIWEIIPFIIFYFLSPLFIEYTPQKKFMEQTQTNIDLSVPSSNTSSLPKAKRNAQKIKEPVFSGVYEDISSSSNMDKTRAFSISDSSDFYKETKEKEEETMTNINTEKKSVSSSYSSDTPLIKVNRNIPLEKDEDVKEYVPVKEKIQDKNKSDSDVKKAPVSNYSANRKF